MMLTAFWLAVMPCKLRGQNLDPERIYEVALGGIVKVLTHEARGTGFLVSEQGYIVTNHHVIAGGRNLRVEFSNGRSYPVIRVVDFLHTNNEDLALLYIGPVQGHRPLPLLATGEARVGSQIAIIGSPLRFDFTIVTGVLSHHENRSAKSWELHHTAPTNRGNSGSALLNRHGQVVGVATGSFQSYNNQPVTGIHIATNASSLRRFLQKNNVSFSTQPLISELDLQARQQLSPAEQRVLEEARLAAIRQQRELDSLRMQVQISEQQGQLQRQQEQQQALRMKEIEFQKLQQQQQKQERRMARKSLPGRLVLKAGGGAHYYMAHWEHYDSNFDAALPAPLLNGMLAYRYALKGRGTSARGNALALFATAGTMNAHAMGKLHQAHLPSGNPAPHVSQHFWELEAGWMFRQWFRLSAGTGQQLIKTPEYNNSPLEYYTTTSGIVLRMGRAELDLTATAMWGQFYKEPALRYNATLNIFFSFARW
ncbi:MAG: S1C family serine protease [Bacteroidales bacterium]